MKLITALPQKLNKRMLEWIKTHLAVVMMNKWLQISKRKKTKYAAVILHLYHVTSFSKACQNLLFVVGFS